MTTLEWQRIEGIVREALTKPEGERHVHLALELGEEPELLANAKRLVRMASRPQADEELPALQSGWHLVLALGMDGLSMDYLAERADGTMEKMVLVKVSRVSLHSSEAQQQFTMELRTLTMLYDSGVARMLDSGWISAGRPFVVVEFDAGVRITDAARELEVKDKMLLFRKVLAGVQYAHLKGVLHGDLRPENVLVLGDDPRLYDFGLTRLLTTGTDSIEAQDVIDAESLAYNSPEQIRGAPITEQSDIYSLGVILYEMLLGRRPYGRPGDDIMQVGRAICEQIPPKIESLDEDANYIVLKALEKNPIGRYASVALMARDVQDYLDGKAVAPRTEALGEFLVRSLKQNWMTATLIAAVLAVGGTALFYKGKADQKADKIQAITKAIFASKSGAKGAQSASTIQSAKKYLDDMLSQNAGKPEVVEELAKAYLQLAEVELKGSGILRGDRGAAIQSARKSYELTMQLMETKGTSEQKLLEYSKSAKMLTEMLREARDYKEAVKVAQDWKQRLSTLSSTNPEYLKQQAAANQALSDLMYLNGEKKEAMPVARTAMQQFASIFEGDKGNVQKGRDYARAANNVGDKALDQGLFGEALSAFGIGAKVLRPEAQKKESEVGPLLDLAKSLSGLGDTLAKTKQSGQARASFLEARQVLEQAAKKEAANEDVKQSLADNYIRTARMGRELAEYATALAETDRAVEILRTLVQQPGANPEFRRDLAVALTIKGEIFSAQGKRTIASELFQEAVNLWMAYSNQSVLKPEEELEFNRLKGLV